MPNNEIADVLERAGRHWLSDWQKLESAAESRSGDESEDSFNIGRRDGFSEAVQLLDVLTGGDGEYRFCTIPDERHCPDPDAMIARIVVRCDAAALARTSGEVS